MPRYSKWPVTPSAFPTKFCTGLHFACHPLRVTFLYVMILLFSDEQKLPLITFWRSESTGLARRHSNIRDWTLRLHFPYNIRHFSLKRPTFQLFLFKFKSYFSFCFDGDANNCLQNSQQTWSHSHSHRVSVRSVGQLLQGGAIDPASSCRRHSMFLCYKSVVA